MGDLGCFCAPASLLFVACFFTAFAELFFFALALPFLVAIFSPLVLNV
jgi:hypothetical protein